MCTRAFDSFGDWIRLLLMSHVCFPCYLFGELFGYLCARLGSFLCICSFMCLFVPSPARLFARLVVSRVFVWSCRVVLLVCLCSHSVVCSFVGLRVFFLRAVRCM